MYYGTNEHETSHDFDSGLDASIVAQENISRITTSNYNFESNCKTTLMISQSSNKSTTKFSLKTIPKDIPSSSSTVHRNKNMDSKLSQKQTNDCIPKITPSKVSKINPKSINEPPSSSATANVLKKTPKKLCTNASNLKTIEVPKTTSNSTMINESKPTVPSVNLSKTPSNRSTTYKKELKPTRLHSCKSTMQHSCGLEKRDQVLPVSNQNYISVPILGTILTSKSPNDLCKIPATSSDNNINSYPKKSGTFSHTTPRGISHKTSHKLTSSVNSRLNIPASTSMSSIANGQTSSFPYEYCDIFPKSPMSMSSVNSHLNYHDISPMANAAYLPSEYYNQSIRTSILGSDNYLVPRLQHVEFSGPLRPPRVEHKGYLYSTKCLIILNYINTRIYFEQYHILYLFITLGN